MFSHRNHRLQWCSELPRVNLDNRADRQEYAGHLYAAGYIRPAGKGLLLQTDGSAFDMDTQQTIPVAIHPDLIGARVAASSDGRRYCLVKNIVGAYRLGCYDITYGRANGARINTRLIANQVLSLAYKSSPTLAMVPDGSRVYTSMEGPMVAYDTNTMAPLTSIPVLKGSPRDLKTDADGRTYWNFDLLGQNEIRRYNADFTLANTFSAAYWSGLFDISGDALMIAYITINSTTPGQGELHFIPNN